MVSAPTPPFNASLPAPPISESLPAAPMMVLSNSLPVSVRASCDVASLSVSTCRTSREGVADRGKDCVCAFAHDLGHHVVTLSTVYVSLPRPPIIVSAPALPFSVSLPAPPIRTLFCVLPPRLSLPGAADHVLDRAYSGCQYQYRALLDAVPCIRLTLRRRQWSPTDHRYRCPHLRCRCRCRRRPWRRSCCCLSQQRRSRCPRRV